jgi:hypothetical protein
MAIRFETDYRQTYPIRGMLGIFPVPAEIRKQIKENEVVEWEL